MVENLQALSLLLFMLDFSAKILLAANQNLKEKIFGKTHEKRLKEKNFKYFLLNIYMFKKMVSKRSLLPFALPFTL